MRFAALVVLAVGLPVSFAASPATAAGSCYRLSCDYKDPQSTGCSADAYNLAEVTHHHTWGSIRIEVRYSPSCQAAWARATQAGDSGQYWAGGNLEWQNSTTGTTNLYSVYERKVRWSSMFSYYDYTLRACYNGAGFACTSWV